MADELLSLFLGSSHAQSRFVVETIAAMKFCPRWKAMHANISIFRGATQKDLG
jgi:hypothetical protein